MRILLLIGCAVCIGCSNSFSEGDKCRYSLKEYLESDSSTVNPKIFPHYNIEQIVDERKDNSFGGIYAFANSEEYYVYRFYVDSNRFTYQESSKDTMSYMTQSPMVYYRIGIDNSNTTYISVYYFLLNKKILNLALINNNQKVKDLKYKKTDEFSNIHISNIYFPKYTPEEVKSFKIYIEGDVLLCNGKKTHFKEPLIWNKEEAEKYAKQQNKLR